MQVYAIFCVLLCRVDSFDLHLQAPRQMSTEHATKMVLTTPYLPSQIEIEPIVDQHSSGEELKYRISPPTSLNENQEHSNKFEYCPPFGLPINSFVDMTFKISVAGKHDKVNSSIVHHCRIVGPRLILFGQSDKNIYSRGDIVRFRFMLLREYLKTPCAKPRYMALVDPSTGATVLGEIHSTYNNTDREPHATRINLINPKGVILQKWFNISGLNTANFSYHLASNAPEGIWKIEAKYLAQTSYILKFVVHKRNRNNIKVLIQAPRKLEYPTQPFRFIACARNTYNNNGTQRIEGVATAKICPHLKSQITKDDTTQSFVCPKNPSNISTCLSAKRQRLVDGCSEFSISTRSFGRYVLNASSTVALLKVKIEDKVNELNRSICTPVLETVHLNPQINLYLPLFYHHGLPLRVTLKNTQAFTFNHPYLTFLQIFIIEIANANCLTCFNYNDTVSVTLNAQRRQIQFITPLISATESIKIHLLLLDSSNSTLSKLTQVLPRWRNEADNLSLTVWHPTMSVEVNCSGETNLTLAANSPLADRVLHIQYVINGIHSSVTVPPSWGGNTSKFVEQRERDEKRCSGRNCRTLEIQDDFLPCGVYHHTVQFHVDIGLKSGTLAVLYFYANVNGSLKMVATWFEMKKQPGCTRGMSAKTDEVLLDDYQGTSEGKLTMTIRFSHNSSRRELQHVKPTCFVSIYEIMSKRMENVIDQKNVQNHLTEPEPMEPTDILTIDKAFLAVGLDLRTWPSRFSNLSDQAETERNRRVTSSAFFLKEDIQTEDLHELKDWGFGVHPVSTRSTQNLSLNAQNLSNGYWLIKYSFDLPQLLTAWRVSGYCVSADQSLLFLRPTTFRTVPLFQLEVSNIPRTMKFGEVAYPTIRITPNSVGEDVCRELHVYSSARNSQTQVEYTFCLCKSQTVDELTFKLTADDKTVDIDFQVLLFEVPESIMCGNTSNDVGSTGQSRLIDSYWNRIKLVWEGLDHLEPVLHQSDSLNCSAGGQSVRSQHEQAVSQLEIPLTTVEARFLPISTSISYLNYFKKLQGLSGKDAYRQVEYFKDEIESGLLNQLTYLRSDGAFPSFDLTDIDGSTWVTATGLQTLARAFKVDKTLRLPWNTSFSTLISYLLTVQHPMTGCYHDKQHIPYANWLYTSTANKSGVGELILTSHVISALVECTSSYQADQSLVERMVENGTRCLLSRTPELKALPTSIVNHLAHTLSYAACFSDDPTTGNLTSDLFQELLARRKVCPLSKNESLVFWQEHDLNPSQGMTHHSLAGDVIDTSLAYLAQVSHATCVAGKEAEATDTLLPTVRWLLWQQKAQGSFFSLGDTDLAIQVLTDYAWRAAKTLKTTQLLNDTHIFLRSDVPLITIIDYDIGSEEISRPRQHMLLTTYPKCKVCENSDLVVAVTVGNKSLSEKSQTVNLSVCLTPADSRLHTDLVLAMVHLATGWQLSADTSQLNHSLPHLYNENRLYFYLKWFPNGELGKPDQAKKCVNLNLRQFARVEHTQPSWAMAVDLRNPAERQVLAYFSLPKGLEQLNFQLNAIRPGSDTQIRAQEFSGDLTCPHYINLSMNSEQAFSLSEIWLDTVCNDGDAIIFIHPLPQDITVYGQATNISIITTKGFIVSWNSSVLVNNHYLTLYDGNGILIVRGFKPIYPGTLGITVESWRPIVLLKPDVATLNSLDSAIWRLRTLKPEVGSSCWNMILMERFVRSRLVIP